MSVHAMLPDHLGGYEVELNANSIDSDETIIGWVDEYGTITNKKGERIGDLLSVEHHECAALVMKK